MPKRNSKKRYLQFLFNRKRVTGEEWLVRQIGAYLPGVYEEVRSVLQYYCIKDICQKRNY